VSRHALYIREIYTGEKEPSGAKDWVPLSKDGILLKTNISRMSKSFPKVFFKSYSILQWFCTWIRQSKIEP
jgi:hypothetical protein